MRLRSRLAAGAVAGLVAIASLAACSSSGSGTATVTWSAQAHPSASASASPAASTVSSSGASVALPPPTVLPQTSTLPAPGAVSSRAGLTIQVTGSCHDFRGFRLRSTGFTPDGQYVTQASYPDGSSYTYLLNGGVGHADANGATPNWTWDCNEGAGGQPDPPGVYTLVVTDSTTGRWVTTTFRVQY